MNMFIIDHQAHIRFSFFLFVFIAMAVWEALAPRRQPGRSKAVRWFHNLVLTVLNSVLVRLIFPAAAVGMALLANERGWGIFNNFTAPQWLSGIASIVLLDLIIYSQHVSFHKIPVLWRLHRMHHTDLDVDVTTGARFHPLEIVLSMVIKMLATVFIGAPAWSVVAFEILLNATSMFNHSNIYLHERIDGLLRLLLVTPDMHRIHHSVIIRETDSNFGFNLPWWDRLFRTYRDQPASGHTSMTLGLANYRDEKWLTLPWMLAVPFSRKER